MMRDLLELVIAKASSWLAIGARANADEIRHALGSSQIRASPAEMFA
jgi:hypothetical protein